MPSARRRLTGREEGVDDDGADPDPQGAHGRDGHLALAAGDVVGDVAGHAAGGQDRAPDEEPGAADEPDRGQQVEAELSQVAAFGEQAPVRRVVDLEAPAATALLGKRGQGRSLHAPSSTALSRPTSAQARCPTVPAGPPRPTADCRGGRWWRPLADNLTAGLPAIRRPPSDGWRLRESELAVSGAWQGAGQHARRRTDAQTHRGGRGLQPG